MDSKLFHKISYGLYVIGSTKKGSINGQIANKDWVCPVCGVSKDQFQLV